MTYCVNNGISKWHKNKKLIQCFQNIFLHNMFLVRKGNATSEQSQAIKKMKEKADEICISRDKASLYHSNQQETGYCLKASGFLTD